MIKLRPAIEADRRKDQLREFGQSEYDDNVLMTTHIEGQNTRVKVCSVSESVFYYCQTD